MKVSIFFSDHHEKAHLGEQSYLCGLFMTRQTVVSSSLMQFQPYIHDKHK